MQTGGNAFVEEVKTAAVGNQVSGNAENSGYVLSEQTLCRNQRDSLHMSSTICRRASISTRIRRDSSQHRFRSAEVQHLANVINGIWDVINDVFFGAIVDKTRTRWGKFKPYLVALGISGTIGTCIYWLLPILFSGRGQEDIWKFIGYLALMVVREGAGTFRAIAQKGIQATITPHPVDRTRLITIADFVSGALGEKLPEQIMTILLDLNGGNKSQAHPSRNIRYHGSVYRYSSGRGRAVVLPYLGA